MEVDTIIEVEWGAHPIVNRRFFSDMGVARDFALRQAVRRGIGAHEFIYKEHRLNPDA